MRTTLALLAALLVAAPLARAAVPQKLGYQGQLLKADGTPVSGIKDLTFTVFDAAQGGSALWTETQTLAFTEGFYATFLGDVTAPPEGLFDGSERWLELTIDGQTLTPRQRIASVPYALRAQSADLALNADHATNADHAANADHATSADSATTATNVSGGTVNATSIQVNGRTVIDGNGQLSGDSRYAAGSGLVLEGNTFSLMRTCADGQVLKWNGTSSAWECQADAGLRNETDPTVGAFAKASLPTCTASQKLSWNGSAWSCVADLGLTSESDPTVGAFAKASLPSCTASQKLSWNGSAWSCVADLGLTSESDPTVSAFAKAAMPSCTASQRLSWNGSAWSCVADANSGGTVTSVSGAGVISVTNGTTTPQVAIADASASGKGAAQAGTGLDAAAGVFSVKYGTIAGTAAAGDDARLSDARTPKGSASGDLAGSYPAPTVTKLQGIAVAPVSPVPGQVLGFTGAGTWTPVGVGSVTSVSGAGPITVANGSTTPTISIANATASSAGAMSAPDKSLFDNVAAQIACTAAGKKIVGNGTGFACVGEDDPKTGTLAAGQLCRTDGSKVLCDTSAPAIDGSGNVTVAGTVSASTPIASANVATKGYVDTTVAAAASASSGSAPFCIYVYSQGYSGVNAVCPPGFSKQTATIAGTAQDAQYFSGSATYPHFICCTGVGGSTPVPADDSATAGYFVQTQTTYTGNLGGLAGADAKCLAELTSKNWLGKGVLPLTSTKVHAFLCDSTNCNNLKPSTRYYFAQAGTVSGGTSFITDRYGRGPNDSNTWPFSVNVFWSNRGTQSGTTWQVAPATATSCTNWTDGTFSYSGEVGYANMTTSQRWDYSSYQCGQSFPLVCYVDP